MAKLPSGAAVIEFDHLDSTNAEALRRAKLGAVSPQWIWARRQTAGYGRRGRAWASAEGDLACTWLAPAPDRPAEMAFVAALAVAEAIEPWCGEADIKLKWPNDVLADGAKLVGVLLEYHADEASKALALGVGVNIVSKPDVGYPVARLMDLSAKGAPNPREVLAALDRRLAFWMKERDASGFASVRQAWLARAIGLSEPITVRLGDRTLEGVFEGLAEDGALLLRREDGVEALPAGEVFFPGRAG